MRTARIRALLEQHESTTLDFKRDQYRLSTDEEKAELLKDILAFANTLRPSNAYIIIGVAEEGHPPHTVTGITAPLLDHHLQQLVNSKLNRPVTFSYTTQTMDGQTIGIITIARQQAPPHHLTKDYGRLTKNTVYLRRGSSTGIATPDEITSLAARPLRSKTRAQPARIQALTMSAMYRENDIIIGTGGRGIPGFAYTPARRERFRLGAFVRVDAKLLITATSPVTLVKDLSQVSITSPDQAAIILTSLTFDENQDTIDITSARTVTIKADKRVEDDVLAPARPHGVTITIKLATAGGSMLTVAEVLGWNARAEAFTKGTIEHG